MSEFDIRVFADEITAVDSELGRIADYEGGDHGPTYCAWIAEDEHWRTYCEKAIRLHREAIELWRKGIRARLGIARK